METLIFNDKGPIATRFSIFLRKTKTILSFLINLLFLSWIRYICRLIANATRYIYNRLYPKGAKVNKAAISIMFLYIIAFLGYIAFDFYYNKKPLNIYLIISIPIIIVSYLIIRLVLWLYHKYIGVYQLLEEKAIWTREYIVNYMNKLLKIYGITGAGKDTTMAGIMSTLSEYFREKSLLDLDRIKNICYFIDFELLDFDLENNYKLFLTFSKSKTEAAFLGDGDNEGIAPSRDYYIKYHYIKSRTITPKILINDYYAFKSDPIMYNGSFSYGVGVNKKHYLDLIMYEYIQWWIRINIEKNYLITNQPFLEEPSTGLMAKQFSFNMLRTKIQKIKRIDPVTRKKEEVVEKVFFPWKDRLVLGETECGTWYMNRDKNQEGIMLSGGARDFKAYNRHFMTDFYWLQVDQAAERTSAMFRELDHSYICVLSREEKEGGAKKNLFLGLALKFVNFRISKEDKRKSKLEGKRLKKQQKIDDLQALYNATSNDKYIEKIYAIESKYKKFKYKKFYEPYKLKASRISQMIQNNLKDGYLYLTVAVSKHPVTISEFEPKSIKDIVQNKKYNNTFVTQLVFRTQDCERYDTRYLRNLAEKRAQETVVNLAEIPNWPITFTFGEKEMEWACYEAAKSQFGISDKAYENLRFGDGYKKHIQEV